MSHYTLQPEPGGGVIIPRIGHPPIALWDINHGLELTSGGIFVGWRDVIGGVQSCPLTLDMTTETSRFSGTRRAVSFNGTTQGLRVALPSFARTRNAVSIHVQFVPADNNATNDRALASLCNDGGSGSGSVRAMVYHTSAAANYIRISGTHTAAAGSATSGWSTGVETVVGASRVANSKLELFVQGVSALTLADTTDVPGQVIDTLLIGHAASSGTISWPFYGSIRRVAIYNVAHDDAEAAAIDAAWRGH